MSVVVAYIPGCYAAVTGASRLGCLTPGSALHGLAKRCWQAEHLLRSGAARGPAPSAEGATHPRSCMQARLHLKACWRCPAGGPVRGFWPCTCWLCKAAFPPLAPEHLLPLLLQVAKLQASIQELQDAHQREEEACAEARQVAEEALQLKRDLEARHVPFAHSKLPSAGGGLRCCCG